MRNAIPKDHLKIVIDTSEPVPAEQILAWARAMLEDARQLEGVDDGTVIQLVHLGQGSPTTLEVAFLGLGAIANLGAFCVAFASWARAGDTEGAQRTSLIVHNHSGSMVSYYCADSEPQEVRRNEIPPPPQYGSIAQMLEGIGQQPMVRSAPHQDRGRIKDAIQIGAQPVELSGMIIGRRDQEGSLFRTGQAEFRIVNRPKLSKHLDFGEELVVTAILDGEDITVLDARQGQNTDRSRREPERFSNLPLRFTGWSASRQAVYTDLYTERRMYIVFDSDTGEVVESPKMIEVDGQQKFNGQAEADGYIMISASRIAPINEDGTVSVEE